MRNTVRRLGENPTLAERLEVMELRLAEAVARIGVLEAKGDAEDAVDGSTPQPLSPNWKPIKDAAPLAGFSESGLRKCIDRAKINGARPWWRYSGGRLLIDVDHCPRRNPSS